MFLSRGGHSRSHPRHDLLLFNCELVLSRNLGFGMPRGCELNVKMSITWDGIHHGTRQGDTESPKYGDLSAVWGEKGPRGKPYLGTLWGNGMSMCMLLSRDCARRGSSYRNSNHQPTRPSLLIRRFGVFLSARVGQTQQRHFWMGDHLLERKVNRERFITEQATTNWWAPLRCGGEFEGGI